MRFISSFALSVLLASFTAGCSLGGDAPTGERAQQQLSGGPGVSIYDFVIDGQRAGTVLVTDGASGDGYADGYEFWLWDPVVTEAVRDGDIDGFTIKIVLRSDKWTVDTVDLFEDQTDGWVAFAIPREFDLQTEPRWAYSYPQHERFAFSMTAPAWGDAGGEIRYYLEMDFQPGSDIPSMEWLVDADDIKTYYASEDSDEDADEDADEGSDEGGYWTLPPDAESDAHRWEVRLVDDAELDATAVAWAYELKTVYPPQ